MHLHFGVSFGGAGAPIDLANRSSIDCNGTADCSFLGAAPDLSVVLVDAAASAPGAACPLRPNDPLRWGVSLLRRKGSLWPPTYTTAWTQCSSADNAKALTSVHLAAGGARVVATFAHATPGTASAIGVEACAYDSASGAELWCTALYKCAGSSVLPAVSAVSADGHLVIHMASVGLLVLNAASKAPPTIELLYGSGAADDCCAATALALADGLAVASIPYGTLNPPWCSCQHSKLVGVSLGSRLLRPA